MFKIFSQHGFRYNPIGTRLYWQPCARSARLVHTSSSRIQISDEVREALDEKRPVVALESTIYTHGLPHPENLDLAFELESIVRSNGGVPATIGVLDCVPCVGLSARELGALVKTPNPQKISRRDLGYITKSGYLGIKMSGGTTISGTMILAHRAGIRVFATGGLGGVHRGDQMDISADLTELGRTPVAVVCSGCKGFLDIPRTLEFLETQGVGVATFADGRTGAVDFPAFWSRDSGHKSPLMIANETEAAAMIHSQHQLSIDSGLLFANPIPTEHSIPKPDMQMVIDRAIELAARAGATGSTNTPFILRAIRDLTHGQSVIANRALVKANIKRGTLVAVELSRLECENRPHNYFQPQPRITMPGPIEYNNHQVSTSCAPPPRLDILVAGSLAVDISCDYAPVPDAPNKLSPRLHTSNPAIMSHTVGGVAANVARAAHFIGANVKLCSTVGNDLAGRSAVDDLKSMGMDTSLIRIATDPQSRTAQYIAVNDTEKNMVLAMSDMSILERASDSCIETVKSTLATTTPAWFVLDANWDPKSLRSMLNEARPTTARIAFEPVSSAKATRLFTTDHNRDIPVYPSPSVDLASPNALELLAMHTAAQELELFERRDWFDVIDALGIPMSGLSMELTRVTSSALVSAGVPQQCIRLLPFIPCILTKLGGDGVLLVRVLPAGDTRLNSAASAPYIVGRSRTGARGVGGLMLRLFEAAEVVPQAEIVSVNGVGDTFLGALLGGLVLSENPRIEDFVDMAQKASVLTLKNRNAVSPELTTLRSVLAKN